MPIKLLRIDSKVKEQLARLQRMKWSGTTGELDELVHKILARETDPYSAAGMLMAKRLRKIKYLTSSHCSNGGCR